VAAVRALFDLQGADPLPEGEQGEAVAETAGVAGREEPS